MTGTHMDKNDFWKASAAIWLPISEKEVTWRNPDFTSTTGDGSFNSEYWFGEDENGGYVIRHADHWGIVQNCAWIFSRNNEPPKKVKDCFCEDYLRENLISDNLFAKCYFSEFTTSGNIIERINFEKEMDEYGWCDEEAIIEAFLIEQGIDLEKNERLFNESNIFFTNENHFFTKVRSFYNGQKKSLTIKFDSKRISLFKEFNDDGYERISLINIDSVPMKINYNSYLLNDSFVKDGEEFWVMAEFEKI